MSYAYPLALAAALGALFPNAATIQALDNSYTPSGTDDFLNDVTGALGDPIALTTVAFTGGILTADNPTITGLAPADAIAAFLIYNDTGSAATSRIVALLTEDSSGATIAFTSDGTNLLVAFPGVTIFAV